jgi:hypothetical protein
MIMALRKPPATLPDAFEMRRLATRPAAAELAHPAQDRARSEPEATPARRDAAPRNVAKPVPKTAAAEPAAPRAIAPDGAGQGSVMLKASLPMPAEGHDATFDAAAQAYGDVKAFRAILSLALDDYVAALREGRVRGALPEHPRRKQTVQVGRAIPANAFELARKALDPLSLLPDGKLGIAILRNALAWRFSGGA